MSEKTHADIIAEMHRVEVCADGEPCLRDYAWRFEAAHKREMDALKQRCAELDAEVAAKDEVIKRLNDAIAEEQRRKMATAENSSAIGNCAKLREALEFAEDELWAHGLFDASKRIASALAAPPRNCDMPLVVDGPADNNADKAWLVFKQHNPDAYFDVSGLLRCIDWLLSPATEKEGGDR